MSDCGGSGDVRSLGHGDSGTLDGKSELAATSAPENAVAVVRQSQTRYFAFVSELKTTKPSRMSRGKSFAKSPNELDTASSSRDILYRLQ